MTEYETTKFVLLSPEGRKPSDEHWTALGYKKIYEILSSYLKEGLIKNKRATDFLEQYMELLEEAIIGGHVYDERVESLIHDHDAAISYLSCQADKNPSKIAELQKLNQDIRRAIVFLIVEKGRYKQILEDYFWDKLIEELGFIKRGSKNSGYFATKELQDLLERVNEAHNKDKRMLENNLLYIFSPWGSQIMIHMYLYPGKKHPIRDSFENLIKSSDKIFNIYSREYGYYRVFDHVLLDENDYANLNIEELKKKLEEKLVEFKKTKAAQIDQYIIDYLAKFPPKSPDSYSPTDKICDLAEKCGNGERFKLLLQAAVRLNLYPKVYSSYIQYAPPQNHNWMLFTVWADKTDNNRLKLFVFPDAFPKFFSISAKNAAATLGEGMLELDDTGTRKFVANLELLLKNAKPKTQV